jgi:hypothetical protein
VKISQPVLIGILFSVLAIAAFLLLTSGPGKYDDFAKCLSDKEVKMYGAFWCPHCKEQKAMFGSSWKYVKYVECSTPDGKGRLQVCIDANVDGYPTWEFKDGSRESGSVAFAELSAKTGCPLPN